MTACEKCWSDAYARSRATGKSQGECYGELLKERKDNPCTPEQQAGGYWDEVQQCDTRFIGIDKEFNDCPLDLTRLENYPCSRGDCDCEICKDTQEEGDTP